jgi:division/cell wall cluster transcriptional repressor MraZ
MRPQFLGRWDCIIDDKRRLTLPAPLRKLIAELGPAAELIVTVGHRGCLLFIPLAIWDEFSRELFQAPVQGDPEALRLRSTMARYGSRCKIDSSGRITLNEEQLRVAGLKREAVVFGNFSRLELWTPERYERENPPITDQDEHDRRVAKFLG